uniref:Dynein light chain n=1 Tax=Steinernema glaseri TaxID=37863 RepID=A0A1I8A6A2_9BILA
MARNDEAARRFWDSTLNLAEADIQVKKVLMDEKTREIAIKTITESLQADLSQRVKSTMDRRTGGPWHCVVGARFSCNTSSERNGYIHVKIGPQVHVILFKTGPLPLPTSIPAQDKK